MKNRNKKFNSSSPSKKTKHHILPTSRLKNKPKQGICKVRRLQHQLYHHLFGNLFPWEILDYLNETFWNGMYNLTLEENENT